MSPHWLVPHWAQYVIEAFVVLVLILVLGAFGKK